MDGPLIADKDAVLSLMQRYYPAETQRCMAEAVLAKTMQENEQLRAQLEAVNGAQNTDTVSRGFTGPIGGGMQDSLPGAP